MLLFQLLSLVLDEMVKTDCLVTVLLLNKKCIDFLVKESKDCLVFFHYLLVSKVFRDSAWKKRVCQVFNVLFANRGGLAHHLAEYLDSSY